MVRQSNLSQACLTAVNGSTAFWRRHGFRRASVDDAEAGGLASYGEGAQYMICSLSVPAQDRTG